MRFTITRLLALAPSLAEFNDGTLVGSGEADMLAVGELKEQRKGGGAVHRLNHRLVEFGRPQRDLILDALEWHGFTR